MMTLRNQIRSPHRNKKTFLLVSVCLLFSLGFSCTKNQTPKTASESELSSLELKFPDGAGKYYKAYELSISPTGSSVGNTKCSPNFSSAGGATETRLSHRVKNGCDYLLVLNLGDELSLDKKTLGKIKYSNKNDSSAGELIKTSQLTGGSVEIPIHVSLIKGAPSSQNDPGSLEPKVEHPKNETPLPSGPQSNETPQKLQANPDTLEPQTPPKEDSHAGNAPPTPKPIPPSSPGVARQRNETPQTPADVNPASIQDFSNVKEIFETHCYECHIGRTKRLEFSQFPFRATGYNSQRELVEAIIQVTSGSSRTMPPLPRDGLSEEQISKLKAWLEKI